MKHITVRMAWHDNGWDGHVCRDPARNSYCVGSHSLLSERLARNRNLDKETPEAALDATFPEYLPPCFWTSAAFAEQQTQVVHMHPFGKYQEAKQILGTLPPNSVFTWPFRLSMTHSEPVIKQHGKYFPDLEERINRFRESLTPNKSLVFFYLNYDNPVAADDYRYALVGCSLLTAVDDAGRFQFDDTELKKLRDRQGMKNFPTLNWALQLSHAGGEAAVRLPYQEYVEYVQAYPEEEAKLEQMRVLIEEPVLLPAFKYVSETIEHDHCLALLYKLRRAFKLVKEHGIVDCGNALEKIDSYIESVWAARGLYPGLGSVVSVLAALADGEPDKESVRGSVLVAAIRASLDADEDLLEKTFELLGSKTTPASFTKAQVSTLRGARAGLQDNKSLVPLMKKLSLFSLTTNQVARILFPNLGKLHPFGGRRVSTSDLASNPYLLCETYVPSNEDGLERSADLDREVFTDRAIDYFTIDIGMFPDRRYVELNDDVQDLTVAGPQRLRAFAIEALREYEARGHSYAPVEVLLEKALAHPLFHKDTIALREEHFLSDDAREHFAQRLFLKEVDDKHFFYLNETKDAEEIVHDFVHAALSAPEHKMDLSWLDSLLHGETEVLKAELSSFDADAFLAERSRLMKGALERSIFCITGRPGSGKTQALRAVLDQLEAAGEEAVVLAPTGKAALRLNEGGGAARRWKAETIDHWIYRSGLASYASGGASLKQMARSEKFEPVQNVIIDEMSMVGLHHLALIFRALEVHQPGSVRRVILVGDENQLPPIACGRPFADTIEFLQADVVREQTFLARLATNCRQKHDPIVLDAAHLFAGKHRYHTEIWDSVLNGGRISDYLQVQYWATAADLETLINTTVDGVLASEVPDRDQFSNEQAFNKLLGLYETGFAPNSRAESLKLDRLQILAPYRGGVGGALSLSEAIRSRYRHDAWAPTRRAKETAFAHSDKIIRIKNLYDWNPATKSKELKLSNGSIGVVCNNKDGRYGYFAESQWRLDFEKLDEEDFELAYAITVHKAQGSEFGEVIVVIPERRAILSRELVYTALTRSKARLTLLVQKSSRSNPLLIARQRSDLATRNSSVYLNPSERGRTLEPEPGVKVQSKVEYVIYKALQSAREQGVLTFEYEREMQLTLDGKKVKVHPDFTVTCKGKTYYWEHLGMLDRRDYASKWRSRMAGYHADSHGDVLLTTDDLGGLSDARISAVIDDLVRGTLQGESGEFSQHHYRL
ncbi:ATP-dependent RecD-like DNA helicase [Massilia sp.]|uniref:ATP-dependent RecD-like DNA helicase n=1 Tax=Massilia sp. TaxID=1882437 RepID=UPI00352D48FE